MDQFIGEIRIFAGNFAPKGWALCNGQLLPIRQNTALFSLLGTVYGGDGKTTFALPDIQGRTTLHQGAGVGLTPRDLGEEGGTSTITLLETQIPSHSHTPQSQSSATQPEPTQAIWAGSGRDGERLFTSESPNVQMSPQAILPAGGSLPHNNMQPYLGLNFIIALEGEYPVRGD